MPPTSAKEKWVLRNGEAKGEATWEVLKLKRWDAQAAALLQVKVMEGTGVGKHAVRGAGQVTVTLGRADL